MNFKVKPVGKPAAAEVTRRLSNPPPLFFSSVSMETTALGESLLFGDARFPGENMLKETQRKDGENESGASKIKPFIKQLAKPGANAKTAWNFPNFFFCFGKKI